MTRATSVYKPVKVNTFMSSFMTALGLRNTNTVLKRTGRDGTLLREKVATWRC